MGVGSAKTARLQAPSISWTFARRQKNVTSTIAALRNRTYVQAARPAGSRDPRRIRAGKIAQVDQVTPVTVIHNSAEEMSNPIGRVTDRVELSPTRSHISIQGVTASDLIVCLEDQTVSGFYEHRYWAAALGNPSHSR